MKKIKNKAVRFDSEKNRLLKAERGVCFEDVILAIENGDLLDDLEHYNKDKYPHQDIFIILLRIKSYVYIVPYEESDSEIFLRTIIPSRKMNKKYNKGVKNAKT